MNKEFTQGQQATGFLWTDSMDFFFFGGESFGGVDCQMTVKSIGIDNKYCNWSVLHLFGGLFCTGIPALFFGVSCGISMNKPILS